MAIKIHCYRCNKVWYIEDHAPAVACDCSGADAGRSHGSPSVPCDSTVKAERRSQRVQSILQDIEWCHRELARLVELLAAETTKTDR